MTVGRDHETVCGLVNCDATCQRALPPMEIKNANYKTIKERILQYYHGVSS